MKSVVKNILKRIPGSEHLFQVYRSLKFRYYYGKLHGNEQLFTDYYKINNWGDDESVSGYGSTLGYTEKLREELPVVFEKYSIESMLDAPCGDFNWMRHVVINSLIQYTGGDIVKPLIDHHKKEFKNEGLRFVHLDIIKQPLPKADVWFCRDCLIHLSDEDIKKALFNFLRSGIELIITTSYTESEKNVDILTGEHRFLNLELPPFNFPKPELYIDDWVEGYPVKKLGLWKLSDLRNRLKQLTGEP